MQLSIANFVESTAAEGPGLRSAIWFQGCPLRCPGCCNPEMLSFQGGTPWSVDTMIERIADAATRGVEGISLLGGEPFAHAAGTLELAKAMQARKLSVMIFSGYTIEELKEQKNDVVTEILEYTDLLIDGRYEAMSPDDQRRWIGSKNQRIHFLSDRYAATDICWQQPDTLEIRMQHGEISVNGFPAKSAAGLWKRPKTKKRDSAE